jgi:hypothetical protein
VSQQIVVTTDRHGERFDLYRRYLPHNNEADPVRGIPDLIGRVLGSHEEKRAIAEVKEKNAEQHARAQRGTALKVVKLVRDDTRRPDQIKAGGGLHGWGKGLVTVEHARAIVQQLERMTPRKRSDWVSRWKRPGPTSEEAQPWVATGIGSGQKSGYTYTMELPLQFRELERGAGVISGVFVGTDTGTVADARIIGVQLKEGPNTDEVIVLTGIFWEFIKTVAFERESLPREEALREWSPGPFEKAAATPQRQTCRSIAARCEFPSHHRQRRGQADQRKLGQAVLHRQPLIC